VVKRSATYDESVYEVQNLNVSTENSGFHSRFSNREIQGLKKGFIKGSPKD